MTHREIFVIVIGLFTIFVLSLLLHLDTGIMNSSDDRIKQLQTINKELIHKEDSLNKLIKANELLIVDLKNKRSVTQKKRKQVNEEFQNTIDNIASTDSITDLIIGADIIREVHKERLSHN